MTDVESQIVQIREMEFGWPDNSQPVLSIRQFNVKRGERVFLKGPSGSGKSTLLGLIAAVLTPQSGDITVDGVALNSLRGGQRDQFRVDTIGLIFQQFNLLPFLSVQDNVMLPCRFSSSRRDRIAIAGGTIAEEVDRLLHAMHLPVSEIRGKAVTNLSVGQQQRVAVARALIGRPSLIVADEPTSALDSDTRQAFLELLFAEIDAAGCTLLFVSHDASLASSFDSTFDLRDINEAMNESSIDGAAT